jgi:hypothetical protein
MIGTTFITFGDDDIEMQIGYETTPYREEVRYLSNGDPGYPAEGGDFDVYEVIVGSMNIIKSLSQEDLEKITELAIRSVEE